jgi:hypothetical protein
MLSASVFAACVIGYLIVVWDEDASTLGLLLRTTLGPLAVAAAIWFLVTGRLTRDRGPVMTTPQQTRRRVRHPRHWPPGVPSTGVPDRERKRAEERLPEILDDLLTRGAATT